MAISRIFPLYIDVTKPSEPLLIDASTNLKAANMSITQGDKFTLRLYFVSATGASPTYVLPDETDTVILAAKRRVSDADLVFLINSWTTGATYLEATFDAALASEFWANDSESSRTVTCDIEVRNSGNSARITYQFPIFVKRQTYGGETAPSTLTPYLDVAGALGIFVAYDRAQTLTGPQKLQARNNLDIGEEDTVTYGSLITDDVTMVDGDNQVYVSGTSLIFNNGVVDGIVMDTASSTITVGTPVVDTTGQVTISPTTLSVVDSIGSSIFGINTVTGVATFGTSLITVDTLGGNFTLGDSLVQGKMRLTVQDEIPAPVENTLTIFGSVDGFGVSFSDAGNSYIISSQNTAARNYTLPDIDGDIIVSDSVIAANEDKFVVIDGAANGRVYASDYGISDIVINTANDIIPASEDKLVLIGGTISKNIKSATVGIGGTANGNVVTQDTSITTANANKLLAVDSDGKIKAAGFSSRLSLRTGLVPIIPSDLSDVKTGTSASSSVNTFGVELNSGTTSTTGYAHRRVAPSNQNCVTVGKAAGIIGWGTSTVEIAGKWVIPSPFDSGAVARLYYGRTTSYPTGDTAHATTPQSIELRYSAANGLQLVCATASTTTTATSSISVSLNVGFSWRIVVSGGIALLYVNDVLAATNSGAPNGDGGATANAFSVGVENVGTVSASSVLKTGIHLMEIY